MLKVFRDNLKHLSWILWVVIAAFILVIFVDFGAVNPMGGAPSAVAATVGGQEVTFGEFQRQHRRLEDQFREAYGDRYSSELAQQLRLPLRALDRLINQKVLLEEAHSMGLEVSDAEVRDAILEFFVDAQGRFVGDQAYRSSVRRQGFSVPEFEEAVREDLLLQKLNDILGSTLYVTDEEVEAAYREEVERARVRLLQLDAETFADQVEVSEEEVASYFEEHRADYRLPERRDIGYLLVDRNRLRAEVDIEEGELFEYYNDNQDQFSRPEQVRVRQIFLKTEQRSVEEAKRQLEEIQRRIEGGEDFAAIAQEVSEDPSSASRGGELGFISRGMMPPEFEEAAFNAEVGQLVGPVEAGFGVHLLEVTERREGGVQPFAEVRSQIRTRLVNQRLPELAESRAQRLRERIEEESLASSEDLQALAEESSAVSYNDPEPIARDEAIPGLGRPRALLDTLFELEVGELTEPVVVPRGHTIAYLEEILEPRDQELDEVADAVRQEIATAKRQQLAIDRLADAMDSIEAGEKTLEGVALELGVELSETGEFGPQGVVPGLGYNPKLASAALSMEEGEVDGPFETATGAVLFEVTARKRGNPEELAERRDEIRTRLEQQQLQRMLTSMVRKRRLQMDVTIQREVLEAFDIQESEIQGV